MLPGGAAEPRRQEQTLVAPDEPQGGDVRGRRRGRAWRAARSAGRGTPAAGARPRSPNGDEARHGAEGLDGAGLEDVGVQRRRRPRRRARSRPWPWRRAGRPRPRGRPAAGTPRRAARRTGATGSRRTSVPPASADPDEQRTLDGVGPALQRGDPPRRGRIDGHERQVEELTDRHVGAHLVVRRERREPAPPPGSRTRASAGRPARPRGRRPGGRRTRRRPRDRRCPALARGPRRSAGASRSGRRAARACRPSGRRGRAPSCAGVRGPRTPSRSASPSAPPAARYPQ